MNVQHEYHCTILQTMVLIPTLRWADERRSDADDLARRAIVERAIRALERQRELVCRQGLARYD